jgi:hypothetical protein
MTETTINAAMTIRRMDLTEVDREAVQTLADRDSAQPLEAPVIGIEVEGRLLAALSLSTGGAVSDPFSRTDELRAILELRAGHLRRREQGGRSILRIGSRRNRFAVAARGVASLPR